MCLELALAECDVVASAEGSNDKCSKEDVVGVLVEDETHADFMS